MTTDPTNYSIGVVVARFQVDDLHEGHHHIIEQVSNNHGKILVFLGIPEFIGTMKNPLDFDTRKKMVQQDYPNAVIMSIPDQPENDLWAKELDRRIREIYPKSHGEVLLYGSRDSFIPSYEDGGGEFDCTELKSHGTYAGIDIRKKISDENLASRDFRYGCIYTAYNQFPRVIPGVDIILMRKGKVMLAKRYNEHRYRFIGSLVKEGSDSFDVAANKILTEKIGSNCEISPLKYLFSTNVDDWRVRNSRDSVISTVFETEILWGHPQPYSKYDEIKEFDISDINHEIITKDHHPILEKYLKIKTK